MNKLKTNTVNTVEDIYNELKLYYQNYLEEICKCISLMNNQDIEYNQEFVRLHRQKLETRNLINLLNMMYVDYASMFLWFDYAVKKYELSDKYRLFSIVADNYDTELASNKNTLSSRVRGFTVSLLKQVSLVSGIPYQQIMSEMEQKYDKIKMFVSA
jgi:hypothetical protein